MLLITKKSSRCNGIVMESLHTGGQGFGAVTIRYKISSLNVPSVVLTPLHGHGEKNSWAYVTNIFKNSKPTSKDIVGDCTCPMIVKRNFSLPPHSNTCCSESCATNGEGPLGFPKKGPNTLADYADWALPVLRTSSHTVPVPTRLLYR